MPHDQLYAPLLVAGPLAYEWSVEAFLSRAEAQWALENLWQLVGRGRSWSGGPLIYIPAIGREAVKLEIALGPGELPWLAVKNCLPGDAASILGDPTLPWLCGVDEPTKPLAALDGSVRLGLDLVSATFLLQTRWEETIPDRPEDEHGRFPIEASHGYLQGYADRPVLDQWAHVVGSLLAAISGRPHPQASWTVALSQDIDHSFLFRSPRDVVRETARTLLRRGGRTQNPLTTLRSGLCSLKDLRQDPYFVRIRELGEWASTRRVRCTTFLMTAAAGPRDEGYTLEDPILWEALTDLQEQGHVFGWHPGYRAAIDDVRFEAELSRYRSLGSLGSMAVRCHYLRWFANRSWRRLADAGFTLDSSLGWPRYFGFRSGTCMPYQVFDTASQTALPLWEHPLILMDTVLTRASLHQNPDYAAREAIRRVREVGGELTVLIHNSTPAPPARRLLDLVDEALQALGTSADVEAGRRLS